MGQIESCNDCDSPQGQDNTFQQYLPESRQTKSRQRVIEYGDNAFYRGEVVRNEPEGYGQYHDKAGEYIGYWLYGLKHGQGKQTLHTGQRYQGQYKHGRFQGSGKYVYSDGSVYEGQFRKGRPEGRGVLVRKEMGQKFEGLFESGQPREGVYFYHNGQRYEGRLLNYQREGKGILWRSEGSKLEGLWNRDRLLQEDFQESKWLSD